MTLELHEVGECDLARMDAGLWDHIAGVGKAETNIYENSQRQFAFDFCEDVNDGRGYTSGIVGFTTGTRDAYLVIDNYIQNLPDEAPNPITSSITTTVPVNTATDVPSATVIATAANNTTSNSTLDTPTSSSNPFTPYLQKLQDLDNNPSGDVSSLQGYCHAWWQSCHDPLFRTTQLNVSDAVYYAPSQLLATKLGLELPVSRGQLYDATVQHGLGTDQDSVNGIIQRVAANFSSIGLPTSPAEGAIELVWLQQFFQERINTLKHSHDKSTSQAWAQSTYRVKSYMYMVANGSGPFFDQTAEALDNDGKSIDFTCDLSIYTNYTPSAEPGKGTPTPPGGSSGLSVAVVVVIVVFIILALFAAVVGVQYYLRDLRRRRKIDEISFVLNRWHHPFLDRNNDTSRPRVPDVNKALSASTMKLEELPPAGSKDGEPFKELRAMLSGNLYNGMDPLLIEHRLAAEERQSRLNTLDARAGDEKRMELVRDLFGAVGENTVVRGPIYVDYGRNTYIGKNCYFNFNVIILDCANVSIGDNVLFAPNVQVYTAGHPLDPRLRLAGEEFAKPIVIKDNVWVGGGAIILPGVTIGENSCVAAGSVVTKDVPANVLVQGNPARISKSIATNV
ncbi:hypothetical protein HK101_001945 [Irineochytrium annulatum]|nr:hypothetical protein HK101_001945 [Irineochytrium annulatum]